MRFARQRLGDPPKKVVDFGCSDGSFSSELASKGYYVVGVDFPDVLKSFQLDPRVKYIGLNLDEPFGYFGPFDVGLCLEILEHLLRDYDFLVNVRERVLNPGGYIIVSTPQFPMIQGGDHHLRHYPETSLLKLLDAAGYQKIEVGRGKNSLLAVAYA